MKESGGERERERVGWQETKITTSRDDYYHLLSLRYSNKVWCAQSSFLTIHYSITCLGSAIYGYNHVVATANKLVKIAKVTQISAALSTLTLQQILGCEVVCTTQYARGKLTRFTSYRTCLITVHRSRSDRSRNRPCVPRSPSPWYF
jgi:hypothetical protein